MKTRENKQKILQQQTTKNDKLRHKDINNYIKWKWSKYANQKADIDSIDLKKYITQVYAAHKKLQIQ